MTDKDITEQQEKLEDIDVITGYKIIFGIRLDLSDISVATSDSAGGGNPPASGYL